MISIPFISLILDGIISNYVSLSTSYFLPLFTLTSLVIIYPFVFKKNIKLLVIIGLLYDIGLTNTLFINTFIFVILMFIIKYLYSYLSSNVFNSLLILIISIILYRVMYYSVLVMSKYYVFDLSILFKSIYASLILNVIYGFILYLIIDRLKK